MADRLFSSVSRSWDMCTSALSEVKELTPEWYTLPDFLTNINDFGLGVAQVREWAGVERGCVCDVVRFAISSIRVFFFGCMPLV